MDRNHAVTATNITHPCSSGSGTCVEATKIQTIVPNSCKERNTGDELRKNFQFCPLSLLALYLLALCITNQALRLLSETWRRFFKTRSTSRVLLPIREEGSLCKQEGEQLFNMGR